MIDPFADLPGFSRRDGSAFCEGKSLEALARTYGTPLYVYSREALRHTIDDWAEGVKGTKHQVFFAMKANSSLGILSLFARAGFGFDIVSGGELSRALAAGADPKKIVYAGVGKTEPEMEAALTAGILCFNVESEAELERLQDVAARLGKTASVSLRVNPNVDAKTHPYISTGLKKNKFGVAYECAADVYRKAAKMPNIHVSGIDCHIGSQITELSPFVDAADKVLDLVEEISAAGITLDHIDFGGGLGVRYNDETPPSAAVMVKAVTERCKERGFGDLPLFFEPGRSLVARAGVLLTTVQYLKPAAMKNFCIVDAGMNDMIRPTLYQADMAVANCVTHEENKAEWEIVGPICETGDWLAHDRMLAVKEGDVLCMTGAGAYGMTMSSTYNSRPRAAEVLVADDTAYLIRQRETVEDLLRHESALPEGV